MLPTFPIVPGPQRGFEWEMLNVPDILGNATNNTRWTFVNVYQLKQYFHMNLSEQSAFSRIFTTMCRKIFNL